MGGAAVEDASDETAASGGFVGFLQGLFAAPWGGEQPSGSWQTVGEWDFERRVLKASLPVLVYFDTAIGCRGADVVFTTLAHRRQGTLEVFYVNAETNPRLARTYGVGERVVFVLFERGRVVRSETASEVLQRVVARNGGFYTDDGFLREMEVFSIVR